MDRTGKKQRLDLDVTSIWSKENSKGRILALIVFLFAFISTAFSSIYSFTRVPYWDSWNLFAWLVSGRNGLNEFVAQNNEHRIVLTRFFALADYHFFGGTGVFLILINLALGLLLLLALVSFIQGLIVGNTEFLFWPLVGLASIAIISMTQIENYAWEFQSQFLLAYLLPVAAIKYFAGATRYGRNYVSTALGLVLSILAAGSMANGVLATFFLGLLALAQKRWKAATAAFTFFAALLALYFTAYANPGGSHSTFAQTLNDPVGFLLHLFAILGSPVFYILGQGIIAIGASMIAGALTAAILVLCAIKVIREYRTHNYLLALITISLFIFASMAIISVGRFSFGLTQAFAGRYMTPSLLLWLTLTFLVIYLLPRRIRRPLIRYPVYQATLVLVILQVSLFSSYHQGDSTRQTGALALELQVPDYERISDLYPNPELPNEVSRQMREQGKGIFGQFAKERFQVGADAARRTVNCQGFIETVTPVPDSEKMRVSGWLNYSDDMSLFRYEVLIVESSSVAFLGDLVAQGMHRPDVASEFGLPSIYSGFEAYVSDSQIKPGPILDCSAEKLF